MKYTIIKPEYRLEDVIPDTIYLDDPEYQATVDEMQRRFREKLDRMIADDVMDTIWADVHHAAASILNRQSIGHPLLSSSPQMLIKSAAW